MNIIDPIAKILGEWSAELGVASIFLRLVVSMIFAAIIGCERSSKRHSAGLRTFIVVFLAATTATMIDIYLTETYGLAISMISAATVIAVAIISSNSILFSSKNQIKGLTTSAAFGHREYSVCLSVQAFTQSR